MDGGDVQVVSAQLLLGHLVAPLQAEGVAPAQGQVAGGVLVVEDGVEQQPQLGDGGALGHQGCLTQVAGALVGLDDVAQLVGAGPGAPLHRLALVEADPEVLDQAPLMTEGQGGVDNALGAGAVGGGEDLLGGHVGEVVDPLLVVDAAPVPAVVGQQAHGEVGAVGGGIADGVKLPVGEELDAALEAGGVVGPSLGRVGAVGPGHLQHGLPQLLQGLLLGQVGEDLFGPGDGGDTGAAAGGGALAQAGVELGAVPPCRLHFGGEPPGVHTLQAEHAAP